MDLNELTPELFEKAEFTERRRGYDIDQVERFLEETGTAVAQLLVRHRQLEERAAHAESRLAEAEQRLTQAEATPATPQRSTTSETDEIERATSTLVMAKRTADATIGEAEAEAAHIRNEAAATAERLVGDARTEAEAELLAGRNRATEVVTALEARRDAVAAVVEGFEQRVEEYRRQLAEVAGTLQTMVDDPDLLAPYPAVHVPPGAAGHTAPGADSDSGSVDLTTTRAHDTAGTARDEGWGQGSWSEVTPPADPQPEAVATAPQAEQAVVAAEPSSATVEASVREPAVVVDAEPVTGQSSDRFLRELDEAVNESPEPAEASAGGEDAMTAFFEGGDEQGRSRFGWRR